MWSVHSLLRLAVVLPAFVFTVGVTFLALKTYSHFLMGSLKMEIGTVCA